MRGNGKELKEAKRFLEAFGIDDDESVDAVRRCSNMLREAKGNGKIGGYLLYGNTSGEIEGEEMRTTVEFCAQLSCGGAVGPYEGHAVRWSLPAHLGRRARRRAQAAGDRAARPSRHGGAEAAGQPLRHVARLARAHPPRCAAARGRGGRALAARLLRGDRRGR